MLRSGSKMLLRSRLPIIALALVGLIGLIILAVFALFGKV